jgi:glycosyltransferase involved in cell wall biosynthesis
MNNRLDSVAIVIPAFNEADNIRIVLNELMGMGIDISRIVVVDDGSMDGTAKVATDMGVKVLQNIRNLGVGYSVQRGLAWVMDQGYELAVRMDADGQHDPRSMPTLIAAINSKRADMVVGSRFNRENHYVTPFLRGISMGLIRVLVKGVCGRYFQDPTCGMRIYNRRAMKRVLAYRLPFYHEPVELAGLVVDGYRVEEAPIVMRPRIKGRSSMNLAGGMRAFGEIARSLMRLRKTQGRS